MAGEGIIQAAVRRMGFTAGVVPTVASHLTDPELMAAAAKAANKLTGIAKIRAAAAPLAADKIVLDGALMRNVEAFLEDAGVPVSKGLTVLKTDAAADALVLTANALEGTGREVVVKMSHELGIFTQLPHLKGDALHIDEPMMAEGVQRLFASKRDGSPVLVRIEKLVQPVDKVLEGMGGDTMELKNEFAKRIREKVHARGLADVDLKANNFGVERGVKAANLDELMRHDIRVIDPGAVKVRTPDVVAAMANPVEYKAAYQDEPLTHIDQLFTRELPRLKTPKAVPATDAALLRGTDAHAV